MKNTNKTNPSVSIIVPAYNVEKYIHQCLSSIEKQTLKDIEVIVVNDGSSDSTQYIIKEFVENDSRFKLINKSNSGYGHSMNIGLDSARGTYIGIVESDDFVSECMIEVLFNKATKNNLDIIKSDYFYYWTKKDFSIKAGVTKNFPENIVFKPVENKKIFRAPPSIWSSLYKRSFLENNKILFLETPGASYQDTSFAFKTLAAADRVMATKEPFLFYRQDNEQSSINNKSKAFCVCDEWSEIESFLNSTNADKELIGYAKFLKFKTYEWNLLRLDKKLRQPFLVRFHKEFFGSGSELFSYKCFGFFEYIKLNLFRLNVDIYLHAVKVEKTIKKLIKKLI